MTAALRRAPTPTPELTTRDGASARLEQSGEAELLTVRDRAGRLLFQYDAETGRGMLVVPEGDLRLCAPRGSIELIAAHGIRAAAGGELSLSSATAASLSVEGAEAKSSVRLEGDRATLQGRALTVDAQETDLSLGDARARAGALHASVGSAELAFGTVLRTAGRVIEQADNLYQRVSELCEIKAGRLRALVREGVWIKGEDTTLLARRDVRVDGEHINIG
jgi:hypothetical protein